MPSGHAPVVDGLGNPEADDGRPDDAHPDVPVVVCPGHIDTNERVGQAQQQQDPAIVLVRGAPPLPVQQYNAVSVSVSGEALRRDSQVAWAISVHL